MAFHEFDNIYGMYYNYNILTKIPDTPEKY